MTWTEVVEELAARLTQAWRESVDLDVLSDDLEAEFTLGGIIAVRNWLLAQEAPAGEDSEAVGSVADAVIQPL